MGKTRQGKPDKLHKTNSNGKAANTVKSAPPARHKKAAPLVTLDEIYLKLFNLTPNAIAVFKLDGTICDVNDLFCQGSGYSREEVIGKTSRELNLFSQDVREKVIDAIAKDGCFRNMEVRHRLKDGSTVTSMDSGDLVRIGDEYYVIVVAQDLTNLKQIEEDLRNEHILNRAIIDNLPGLFFIIDENFRFLLWNDNFTLTTGYSAEEMKTMTALDLHPESRRRAAAERIKHGFLSGHFNHEENVVFKDGADCTLLITASRIPYDGKTCLIGTCIDITEKKKAQDQLKRFAANLEEANITLRVLMKHNKQEQKHFENKLQTYVNDLVMPYLDKLRKANLDERSKKYLRELENNLTGVLSPFLSNFQTLYKKLTPQEIQIVDLIGKGKCTKEIADMLNVAVNTVATHRNNIRKKLNLRNAKVNLRSHLMSLR